MLCLHPDARDVACIPHGSDRGDHVEDVGEAALRINGAMSVTRNIMFFVFVIYTHCVTRFLSDFSRPLSLSVFCSNMSMYYLFSFG